VLFQPFPILQAVPGSGPVPPEPTLLTAVSEMPTAHSCRVDVLVKMEGTGSIDVYLVSWSQGREFSFANLLGTSREGTSSFTVSEAEYPDVVIGATVDIAFSSEQTDQLVTIWAVAR